MIRVPRISYRAEVRIRGRNAVCALVHVELTKHYSAGRFQLFNYGCVVLRNELLVDPRASSRDYAARVEEVLHGDRYTVQRTEITACGELLVGLAGAPLCGLPGQSNERLQFGIKPLRASKCGAGQLGGGNFTCAKG